MIRNKALFLLIAAALLLGACQPQVAGVAPMVAPTQANSAPPQEELHVASFAERPRYAPGELVD